MFHWGPWRAFEGFGVKTADVDSHIIKGDPDVAPTRWWNEWWLALGGWKTAETFYVPAPVAQSGYRIGYLHPDGTGKILDVVLHHPRVRMRARHEDVKIFVLNRDGGIVHPVHVDRGHVKGSPDPLV